MRPMMPMMIALDFAPGILYLVLEFSFVILYVKRSTANLFEGRRFVIPARGCGEGQSRNRTAKYLIFIRLVP